MKKPVKVRPSAGEIAILAMLWREGPLSLAQAHQRFGQYGRPVGYPTMQTRLNRLSTRAGSGEARIGPRCIRRLLQRMRLPRDILISGSAWQKRPAWRLWWRI